MKHEWVTNRFSKLWGSSEHRYTAGSCPQLQGSESWAVAEWWPKTTAGPSATGYGNSSCQTDSCDSWPQRCLGALENLGMIQQWKLDIPESANLQWISRVFRFVSTWAGNSWYIFAPLSLCCKFARHPRQNRLRTGYPKLGRLAIFQRTCDVLNFDEYRNPGIFLSPGCVRIMLLPNWKQRNGRKLQRKP